MTNEKKEPQSECKLEISGDLAMFVMPASKLSCEWMSYPFPTYGSLIGIMKRVYYRPGMIWHVDEVRVMNPIRYAPIPVRSPEYQEQKRFVHTYLYDVRYQVKAHYTLDYTKNDSKDWHFGHDEAIEKSLRQEHGLVKLGKSNCLGFVSPCEYGKGKGYYDDESDETEIFMFYQFSGDKETRMAEFANIKMKNGVIKFDELDIKKRRWGKRDVLVSDGKNGQGNL